MGFYGSNDPTNSVKALKEERDSELTVLEISLPVTKDTFVMLMFAPDKSAFTLHIAIINQSINQSIFIYIRHPEPIVARPIHYKKKKEHTTLSKCLTLFYLLLEL